MKKNLLPLLALTLLISCKSGHVKQAAAPVQEAPPNSLPSYVERNGIVAIEAEHFASQTQADLRRWLIIDKHTDSNHGYADPDLPHVDGASGGAYIEVLPDTRVTHAEKLIAGENFVRTGGKTAILTYPVYFNESGRYTIWGRAFSTGSEDNGMHFGLDGTWPESSQRLQFCEGKSEWTWSSSQRRDDNHCGTPATLWIDVPTPGQHLVMMSMREDGAELDKIILTKDAKFVPEGEGPAASIYTPRALTKKKVYLNVDEYTHILHASRDFEIDKHTHAVFYHDKHQDVLGINAAKTAYRNVYARAHYQFKSQKKSRDFNVQLITLAEIDGESTYRVLLNDELIAEVQNPETTIDYEEIYFDLGRISIKSGDVLSVESNAVTNGKIPEGDGTAFARGRWRGIVLKKIDAE